MARVPPPHPHPLFLDQIESRGSLQSLMDKTGGKISLNGLAPSCAASLFTNAVTFSTSYAWNNIHLNRYVLHNSRVT